MKLLTFIALALAVSSATTSAQQKPHVSSILGNHAAEKLAVEATHLALYADQLETLRQNLAAKQNEAGVAQVVAEYQTVMKQLTTAQTKAVAEHAAAAAAAEKAMQAIFSGDDEADSSGHPDLPLRALTLRSREATWLPAGTPKRNFWALKDAALKWTINDLAPGKYQVRLMFRCPGGEGGGTGQLEISGNSTPVPFRITPDDTANKKLQTLDISILTIEKCPIDLTIRATGHIKAETPIFDLIAVWLMSAPTPPAAAPKERQGKETVPPATDSNRKKVDF